MNNGVMTQQELGLNLSTQRTRKAVCLDETNLVVPWSELLSLISPYAPCAKSGRPPFEQTPMLRIHFLQQWFGLSDLTMEEALFETALYREFAGISSVERIPDRVSILRFRHMRDEHQLAEQILPLVNATLADKCLMLREGTVVNATLIAAPSSTKNSTDKRYPEMHQTKKGSQWHFGMNAHIGVDADSGLVRSVVGTAANVNGVTQASALVHVEETDVLAEAGYQGMAKREEVQGIEVNWNVAMRPGKRRALGKDSPMGSIIDKIEHVKARIRPKLEHPFRFIKHQFGHMKVRWSGQEHCAVAHAVCAVQSVGGAAKAIAGVAGMSAPANGQATAVVPKAGGANAETALNCRFWVALFHVMESKSPSAGTKRVMNNMLSAKCEMLN